MTDRSVLLNQKIAALCKGEQSDVILSSMLSGVVTVIRACYPAKVQAEVLAQFVAALHRYLDVEHEETLQ